MNTSLSPPLTSFLESLRETREVYVRQRFEIAEMFGFETRNKYSIESETRQSLGFVAEERRGILDVLFRNFLGHWRRFSFTIFDSQRQPLMTAHHPFRWYFQRLEVYAGSAFIGALQHRFSILTKKFDVEDAQGQVILRMESPFWRIWTFPFRRLRTTEFEHSGVETARIEKRWSGLLSEGFTDKDTFRIRLRSSTPLEEVALVLAASIFVDLQYFETKGEGGGLRGLFRE